MLALARAGGSSHRQAVHGVEILAAKIRDISISDARIWGAMGPFVLSFFPLRRGASEVRG